MPAGVVHSSREPNLRLVRLSGLLYLAIALLGLFAPTVVQSLIAPGDAAATARNLVDALWLFGASLVAWVALVAADAAVAVSLYLLLAPVSRAGSMVMALSRLIYAAVVGALLLNLYQALQLLPADTEQVLSRLDTFNAGFQLALALFGMHLVALGILLYRSRYLPRLLALLIPVGGAGYIIHGLARVLAGADSGLAGPAVLMPALAGELWLTGWLLWKGFSAPRRRVERLAATAA